MKLTLNKLMVIPAATLLFGAGAAEARSISPDEALARINREARAGALEMPSVRPDALRLSYTYEAQSSIKRPMMYVFTPQAGKGFVLSPADDEFPAVLGYSGTSPFDSSNISPSLQWWLGQYEKEMDWLLTHPQDEAPMRTELGDAIEPLVKTKWDQSAPFNDLAPMSSGRRTMTGCVATAMAQVMKYHNYPENGTGWITYKWNTTNLSFDFSSTTFDWDNMLDVYTGGDNRNYSQTEANAVATLMQACGYSVKMNYGLHASGTSSYLPPAAFTDYFNYSKDIRNLARDFMTIMEWEQVIYENLKAKLPVLLTGQAETGGHAFVCDGYSSNHYFHINWGWGGYQDGYFLLSMLNPLGGGIGSAQGGYNSMQTAIVNIKPEKGGTPATPRLYCNGDFTFAGLDEDENEYMFKALGTTAAGFYNFGSTIFKGQVGLIVENPDKTVTDYPYDYVVDVEPGFGVAYIPGPVADAPTAGEYRIYPGYRHGDEGALIRMDVHDGCNPYVVMTIDAQGKAAFANAPADPDATADIEVTDFKCLDDIVYRNFPASFSVTVRNKSSKAAYSGPITMKLTSGITPRQEKEIFVTVWPDESFTQTAALTWTIEAGEYNVSFYDTAGKEIGKGYKLTIDNGSPTGLQSHLKITGLSPTKFNPGQTYALFISFTNDYAAPLTLPVLLSIYDENDKVVSEMEIPSVTFPANTTGQLQANGFTADFGTGKFYLRCFSRKDAVSEKIPIEVGDAPESITVTPSSAEVVVDETVQLEAQVLPAGAVHNAMEWTSSNPAIATVSRTGLVKGIKEGQVTVTATIGSTELKATCEVTVKSKLGSVDEIAGEDERILSVTTADGVVIDGVNTCADLKKLDAGVYVVKTTARTIKVTIGK